ncbi:MAG: hypothetical protein J2O38_05895 [Acidimicrobiales bacterium]|nr:hypothetical protein [Acidimicrobiales bacterium]
MTNNPVPTSTVRKSTTKLLAGGIAGLTVLGLGPSAAFASEGHGSAQGHAAYASERTAPSPSYSASVAMQAMPAGTVTFKHLGSMLEARISAFGLTPGSTHLAQITVGDRRAPITFAQFSAGATGQVDTTVQSLQPVRRLPEGGTFQIEQSSSPGQPIAVTRVPGGKGRFVSDPLPLQAVEASSEGQLAGHANLTYNGRTQTLTVRVDALGFAPNTNHAAHIHMGTCTVQGAPIDMLQDLHADGRGQIDQTDVIHNLASFTTPAGGWYLNIHEGSGATILDGAGNPTPLFRPLLCSNLPPSSAPSPAAGNQSRQPASPGMGSPGMGMSSSSGNGGGQPGSQGGSTSTTMPSGSGTTMPASSGSGTTPASQPENLNVSFIPNGSSSGSAVVSLRPADNQVSVTANLSGFNQPSVEAQIVTGDNDTIVSLNLNATSPGSFQGSAQLSSSFIKEIKTIPEAYKLRVSAGGNSAHFLLGVLKP